MTKKYARRWLAPASALTVGLLVSACSPSNAGGTATGDVVTAATPTLVLDSPATPSTVPAPTAVPTPTVTASPSPKPTRTRTQRYLPAQHKLYYIGVLNRCRWQCQDAGRRCPGAASSGTSRTCGPVVVMGRYAPAARS
jgi:hypothetical protein